MFFVDKPYISNFLKQTVLDNSIPVVATDIAKKLDLYKGTQLISEEEAVESMQRSNGLPVYCTSENSIGWIAKYFAFSDLPTKIAFFKDKLQFRKITEKLYPNFFFQEVLYENLQGLNLDNIPFPVIVKPAVGFFSMGVYKVSTPQEWQQTVSSIKKEINQSKELYPEEVLDTNVFIIEQIIDGEEYAMDAYYNASGEAVILSIFHHVFSSESDVSDRIYNTSKELLEENLEEFTHFLERIGEAAKVRSFPVHVELRRQKDGTLLPIEVNPMRFGGWCSTADMASYAYGFNPYLLYYKQQKPDWKKALEGKEGKLFSLIILDNSTNKKGSEIDSFDYEKLLATFEQPLELRKINYKKYPVFGFLFTETNAENTEELNRILHSDLTEFIEQKTA